MEIHCNASDTFPRVSGQTTSIQTASAQAV
jgi:hypothetical protein